MLNDKEVSKEVGQSYLDKLPKAETLTSYFTEIEE